MTDARHSDHAGDPATSSGLSFKAPLWERAIRNILNILISGVLIVLLLPLLVTISLAIFIDAPGAILVRQRRIGINGKTIVVHKFRTMSLQDLHFAVGQQVIWQDPRMTRVGRILRQTSLDELPQLFDVLSGNLALVGPRPILSYEMEGFRDNKISVLLNERLMYKPGLTGLAQISGLRSGSSNIESFEQMIELDLKYMRNRTIMSDIIIILRTITSVASRNNAY